MAEIRIPVQIVSKHWVAPRLDVYYPVVVGLPNMAAERRINRRIINLLNRMIRDTGYYENPQTEVTGIWEVKTNERGILSLSIEVYWFSGGAHGMTVIKSLTMDVRTGQLYNLKDLFKPDSDYLKRLSEIVERQIRERKIMLLDEFKGIRPDQDFYIADKSLVIYFQLYEITPYAAGFQYFPISVYEIQDIILEEGPLGKMLY